jgi:hypothetical protein
MATHGPAEWDGNGRGGNAHPFRILGLCGKSALRRRPERRATPDPNLVSVQERLPRWSRRRWAARSSARPRVRTPPIPSIVLDLLPVAEAPDNKSAWPPLPPDCRLAGAKTYNQPFYRFSDGSDPLDWALPVVIWGVERAAHSSPERQCQAHAFSISVTPDALRRKKRRVKRFRDHRIVRFTLNPSMGVALETPSGSSHYSWWPDVNFIPPPDDTEFVE